MLRKEPNAAFEKTGFWAFSRYRFACGKIEARKTLSRGAYERLLSLQREAPVLVLDDEERKRRWWLFQGEFYSDDDGFGVIEVKALLLERASQRRRRVRRAVALMEQTQSINETSRSPIPDDVRVFVWNRDGGRCVRCGAAERLEFDHLIPLALGGSNTARNLQILCETCNRAKGASIA